MLNEVIYFFKNRESSFKDIEFDNWSIFKEYCLFFYYVHYRLVHKVIQTLNNGTLTGLLMLGICILYKIQYNISSIQSNALSTSNILNFELSL